MPRFLEVSDTSVARSYLNAAHAFTVSTYYGGTLGGGDDTTCIQNTIDACYEAGGGLVLLPPGRTYLYEQLIIKKWVRLSGSAWHTYSADGSVGRMRQLAGVNDDSIIFTNTAASVGEGDYAGPCGLTDLSIRGAEGATAGNAVAFKDADGNNVGVQDLCSFERLHFRGFAESGIYVRTGVPIHFSDIGGRHNGNYIIEIDGISGGVHQVSLTRISGDANMGGESDGAGAAILLKNLNNPACVVINGLKSENRKRSTVDGGDGTVMGNEHALIIENCSCPVAVNGIEHISTLNQTKKPGNVIQIVGAATPELSWTAATVRVGPSQTVGDDPYIVYDEVNSRGSESPQGFWGSEVLELDSFSISQSATISSSNTQKCELSADSEVANSNQFRVSGTLSASSGTQRGVLIQPEIDQSGTAAYTGLDVNVQETAAGSGTKRIIAGRSSNSTVFAVNTDGSLDIGASSDTTLSRTSAGHLGVEGNPLGMKVAVPASAGASGTPGEWAVSASYVYFCVSTDTWVRAAVASW